MRKESKNIVIFPKWKEQLERDSFNLLKQNKYTEALQMFNELLKLGESSHEIIFGQLLCLAELEQLSEAIHILEQLIFDERETRFEYVHMYVTMLYQTREYEQLIQFVEEMDVIKGFPQQYKEHIEQLYRMSQTYKLENIQKLKAKYSERLIDISESNQYQEQRHIIHTLKQAQIMPTEKTYHLLANKKVHPVIKTDLLLWFKRVGINKILDLEKLGLHKTVTPVHLTDINEQTLYNEIIDRLNYLEHKDPTLFTLIEKTFKRFLYVWFPFPIDIEKAQYFATALKLIVEPERGAAKPKTFDPHIKDFMKTISICEALYLSVIDE